MSYWTARAAAAVVLLLAGAIASPSVSAQQTYHPIQAGAADRTVTLTGSDLTIDQVIGVAREGAKVAVTPQARQPSADRYGLLLEGAAEGMSIYRLNRQAGAGRQIVTFSGSPMTAANQAYLKQRELEGFRRGALAGYGAEVEDEDVVRAAMVVRLNALTYAAVTSVLLAIALVASLVPASRATRIDPVRALRAD